MAIHNFPSQYRKDTFRARTITLTQEENTPLNLTGASIIMEFRKASKTGSLLKRISVGEGISMPSPETGIFIIDQFNIEFPVGNVYFDCKITIGGITTTYFEGIIVILQNVTEL